MNTVHGDYSEQRLMGRGTDLLSLSNMNIYFIFIFRQSGDDTDAILTGLHMAIVTFKFQIVLAVYTAYAWYRWSNKMFTCRFLNATIMRYCKKAQCIVQYLHVYCRRGGGQVYKLSSVIRVW